MLPNKEDYQLKFDWEWETRSGAQHFWHGVSKKQQQNVKKNSKKFVVKSVVLVRRCGILVCYKPR